MFLGDESLIDAMRARIEQSNRVLDEVPRAQRAGRARSLAEYEDEADSRNSAIAAAYASDGYSMKEIGQHFSLHYSRVSRIVRQFEFQKPPRAKGKT